VWSPLMVEQKAVEVVRVSLVLRGPSRYQHHTTSTQASTSVRRAGSHCIFKVMLRMQLLAKEKHCQNLKTRFSQECRGKS
jgi:hypothetical protein